MLLKYNEHNNVEICTTVTAVKYLYKYGYKGHDRAIVEFSSGENANSGGPKRRDEVANYLEAKYVSATEACYRKQSVMFSANAEYVLRRQKHTTLTAWFVANQEFPNALELTYTDFPDKFVWDKPKREWKPRVMGIVP